MSEKETMTKITGESGDWLVEAVSSLHHENRFKKIVKGVSVDTRFFFRSRAILGVT